MYVGLPAKYALLLSVVFFKESSFSSTALRNILRYKISWESVLWEPSCCVRTCRHDEANSRFPQYSGARLQSWDTVQRNGLGRIKERKCCRYDDVRCSVTAWCAAFTFVQRCEPLMPNMLHNSRGFHTEPLAGHIHRHPVPYVRRNIRTVIIETEACVFSERLNIERHAKWHHVSVVLYVWFVSSRCQTSRCVGNTITQPINKTN